MLTGAQTQVEWASQTDKWCDMKIKVLIKSARTQNQSLTIGKEYFVVDTFQAYNDKWVTVILNDIGEDTELYDNEFEEVTQK